MSLDLFLFQKINQFAGKNIYLDRGAIFFAKYFEFILVLFLISILVKNFRRFWPTLIQTFLAVSLSRLIITETIRWLFPRNRPFVENEINLLFFHNPTEPSFPSGHATFFFAIAAVIYFHNKKNGILFFLSGFLISFARVFSGIHWPSDVLAGALIGIFSGWLAIVFWRKIFIDSKKRLKNGCQNKN